MCKRITLAEERMAEHKRKRASPCQSSPLKCSGCKKRIRSRFFVTALGENWHERCLTCDVCNEILFSFGSGKCYCRDGMKLCLIDYARLYGKQGVCSMCDEVIQATEKVMKFKDYIYHMRCFHCSICNAKFKKGNVVAVPKEKLILCSVHHSEYAMSSTYNKFMQPKSEPLNTTTTCNNTNPSNSFLTVPNTTGDFMSTIPAPQSVSSSVNNYSVNVSNFAGNPMAEYSTTSNVISCQQSSTSRNYTSVYSNPTENLITSVGKIKTMENFGNIACSGNSIPTTNSTVNTGFKTPNYFQVNISLNSTPDYKNTANPYAMLAKKSPTKPGCNLGQFGSFASGTLTPIVCGGGI